MLTPRDETAAADEERAPESQRHLVHHRDYDMLDDDGSEWLGAWGEELLGLAALEADLAEEPVPPTRRSSQLAAGDGG